MKKIALILFVISLILVSCDPVEERESPGGHITIDQLNVSAVPEIREGVNSNYVVLNSDGNKCLSSWDYGSGTVYVGTKTVIKLDRTGDIDITFTGLCADGTKLTKILSVRIDRLFD